MRHDLIGYYSPDIIGGPQFAIGQTSDGMPLAPAGYPGLDAAASAAAAAQIAARDSFILNQQPYQVARVEFIGFGSVEVAPGETVCLEASPQVPCKADRFFVIRGEDFVIHSIKFGKWELFAGGCGAVPAAIFAPNSEDTVFNSDTIGPGCKISLLVENVGSSCQKFTAGMRLKCVER